MNRRNWICRAKRRVLLYDMPFTLARLLDPAKLNREQCEQNIPPMMFNREKNLYIGVSSNARLSRFLATTPTQESNSEGKFSLIYSTTASGPFCTCSPCGREKVFTSGTISFAMLMILCASSGVHMDAVN